MTVCLVHNDIINRIPVSQNVGDVEGQEAKHISCTMIDDTKSIYMIALFVCLFKLKKYFIIMETRS